MNSGISINNDLLAKFVCPYIYYLDKRTNKLDGKNPKRMKKGWPEGLDHVVKYWVIEVADRQDWFWMLIEAATLGADETQIKDFRDKWNFELHELLMFLGKKNISASLSNRLWVVGDMSNEVQPSSGKDLFESTITYFKNK